MKKLVNRTLSMLLSLVMLTSILPSYIFATAQQVQEPENLLKGTTDLYCMSTHTQWGFEPQPADIANVVDGDRSTWCYGGNAEWAHTYQIAFEDGQANPRKVNKMVIVLEPDTVNGDGMLDKIELQITKDAIQWNTVKIWENVSVLEQAILEVEFDDTDVWGIKVMGSDNNCAMFLAEVEACYIAPPPPPEKDNLIDYNIASAKTYEVGKDTIGNEVYPKYAYNELGERCDSQEVDLSNYIVDGNTTSTSWGVGGYYNQTNIIDLGKEITANQIKVWWYTPGAPISYEIWLSTDRETWYAEVPETFIEDSDTESTLDSFRTTKFRYVKLVGTASQAESDALKRGFTIKDVAIYYDEEVSVVDNPVSVITDSAVAYMSAAEGGKNYFEQSNAQNAIDDDLDSVANTSQKANWTLTVDLGELTTDVNGASILFGGDAPKSYKIQSSMDGVIWKTNQVVQNGENYTELVFPETIMRYVRVVDTSADDKPMQVKDFDVFVTRRAISTPTYITDIYPENNSQLVDFESDIKIIFSAPLRNPENAKDAIRYTYENYPYPMIYTFDVTGTILTIKQTPNFTMNRAYPVTIYADKIGIKKYPGSTFTTGFSKTSWPDNLALLANTSFVNHLDDLRLESSAQRDANLALDGNYSTYAVAQPQDSNNAWAYQLEFDEVQYGINRINVYLGGPVRSPKYIPDSVTLMSSVDGENWETFYQFNPTDFYNPCSFNSRKAKYIRILGENADDSKNMGIAEIEILAFQEVVEKQQRIIKTTPANKQKAVSSNAQIVLEFAKSLPADFDFSAITISKLGGEAITASYKIDATDKRLTVTPDTALDVGAEYVISVDSEKAGLDVAFEDVVFKTKKEAVGDNNIVTSDMTVTLYSQDWGSQCPCFGTQFPEDHPDHPNFGKWLESNAVDGDYSTGTQPVYQNGYAWTLELDLGEKVSAIEGINVVFAHNEGVSESIPADFSIHTSVDGVRFEQVANVRKSYAEETAENLIILPEITARYIRITDNCDRWTDQYDKYGNLTLMVVNEIEVFQADDNSPLEVVEITPKNEAQGLSLDTVATVTFSRNIKDQEVDLIPSVITLKKGNEVVPATVARSAQNKDMAIITPTEQLEPGVTYTIDVAQSDELGLEATSTTFTTNDLVYRITTTSSTFYREDNDNAIYPAFVDNYRYQAWTYDGETDYFQLKTENGVGNITWEITSGRLPEGLVMSQDGKISGLATKVETCSFSVKATDEAGNTTTKTLTMQANPFKSKWYEDAKFGINVQWGCFSGSNVVDTLEEIAEWERRAVDFDPKEWVDEVEKVGGKVLIFTVMGGDMIRMWPSTTPTRLELKTQRNYVGELIEECHSRGIKFMGYLPGSYGWIGNIDTGINEEFNPDAYSYSTTELQFGVLEELIDMGMDGLWVDLSGSLEIKQWFDWDTIGPMIRSKNPYFIVGSNPMGTNNGWVPNYKYMDYCTTEGKFEPGSMRVASWSRTPRRMASDMWAMWQKEWSDTGIQSDIDTILTADEAIQNIKDNWANGVTYMPCIVVTETGEFLNDAVKEIWPAITQWVNNNIDNQALFGYNRNKKQVDNVEYGKASYPAFKAIDENAQITKEFVKGDIENMGAYIGMEFVSPANKVTVTKLGRYYVEGNDQKHTLMLARYDWPYEILREVEIDMATAPVDEDGFAYVDIEPITLNPNDQYYILSSEDTTDVFATPDMTNLTGDNNFILSSVAWTDVSRTRIYSNFTGQLTWATIRMRMPKTYFENDFGYNVPIPNTNPQQHIYGVPRGGLVNIKTALDDETIASTNIASSSHISFHSIYGQPGSASADKIINDVRNAIDGDINTIAACGDGFWQHSISFDFGSVKKQIDTLTINYAPGSYARKGEIYTSENGRQWNKLLNFVNNRDNTITLEFDPIDTRYIKIMNLWPADVYDPSDPGYAMATAEISVTSANVALDAKASFVEYKGGKTTVSSASDENFALFATDSNPLTVAKTKNAGALKLELNGWKEITEIGADSADELEFLYSRNGTTWEEIPQDSILSSQDNTLELSDPIVTKYLLIRNKSQTALEVTDVYVIGEKADYDLEEVPDPEQPTVGGGGGGSAEPTTPAPEAPTVKPGWVQDSDGQWSYGQNDGTATIGWAKLGGIWYHFDDNGIMQTGWYKDTDGKWYYFDSNGAMAIGWVHDGNAWYYMAPSGAMMTGWVMVNSKWYYLDGSGAMVVGWRQVGASWYYFMPNGAMVTGWQLIGGKWYYMHSTGSMAFNQWIYLNGKWYYVTSDGSMAVNTIIDGYTLDQNGAWVK